MQYRIWVDLDQEYLIQYKRGWSHFSKRKVDQLVLAPKWRYLWMEWIWVLWTQLPDPTCKAKWLKYLTWYYQILYTQSLWRSSFVLWSAFWHLRKWISLGACDIKHHGLVICRFSSKPIASLSQSHWLGQTHKLTAESVN
jgi:hypothetical protein